VSNIIPFHSRRPTEDSQLGLQIQVKKASLGGEYFVPHGIKQKGLSLGSSTSGSALAPKHIAEPVAPRRQSLISAAINIGKQRRPSLAQQIFKERNSTGIKHVKSDSVKSLQSPVIVYGCEEEPLKEREITEISSGKFEHSNF
jgi:hypothetical protein